MAPPSPGDRIGLSIMRYLGKPRHRCYAPGDQWWAERETMHVSRERESMFVRHEALPD